MIVWLLHTIMFVEFICTTNSKFERLSDIFTTSSNPDNSLLEYGDTEIFSSILTQEDYDRAFKYNLFDNDVSNIIDIVRKDYRKNKDRTANFEIYIDIMVNEINKTFNIQDIAKYTVSDDGEPTEADTINATISKLLIPNMIFSNDNVALQVFTMTTKSMYLIVQHLKNYYDNVYIFKPEFNANMTYEKYIVCLNRNKKKYAKSNSDTLIPTDENPFVVPNRYYLDSSFNAIKEINGREFAIMIKKMDEIREKLTNGVFTESLINEYNKKQLENDKLYIEKWYH
jgi:hypothetical protein